MTLVCLVTEGRMIAALIVESEVLRDARELETDDFTDPRLRAAFSAIRNLQARAMLVDVHEIDAEMRRTDERCGTTVAEKSGLAFLAGLMLATAPYGVPILWEHDLWYLRELANRRRSAIATAEAA